MDLGAALGQAAGMLADDALRAELARRLRAEEGPIVEVVRELRGHLDEVLSGSAGNDLDL